MMSDFLFSDAGWFFFVIWSVAVATVNIAAFGGGPAPLESRKFSRAGCFLHSCSTAKLTQTASAIGNVGTAAFGCPPCAAGLGLPT